MVSNPYLNRPGNSTENGPSQDFFTVSTPSEAKHTSSFLAGLSDISGKPFFGIFPTIIGFRDFQIA
jgi:hypothetical protein